MIPASLVALAVAACIAAAPLGPDAVESVERAQAYVAQDNYPAARAALAEAAATQEHPAIVFAQAQVERLAGECAAAIEFYEAFAALQSDPADASEAHRWIAHCRAQLPQPPPPEPEPPAPVATQNPDTSPALSNDAWRRDAGGAGLVAGGAVILASGIGILAAGLVGRPSPSQTATEGEYASAVTRSRALVGTGSVLVPVGVSIALAGVIRYVFVARHSRAARASVGRALTTFVVRF